MFWASKRQLLLFVLVVGLSASSFGNVSFSAQIDLVQATHCNIALKGEIVEGDLAQLTAMVEKAQAANINEISICLDSPAGNFDEGWRIIEYLLEGGGIGTVVDKGAECRAVCAYIFLAGRFTVFHSITHPLRRLHVGGTLSFEIPQLAAPDARKSLTAEELEQAYSAGVRKIAALLRENTKIGTDYRDAMYPFPRTLLAAVLQLEDNQALWIKTIEHAAKWKIEVLGFQKPDEITTADLFSACLITAELDGPFLGEAVGAGTAARIPPQPQPIPLAPGQNYRTTFQNFGKRSEQLCVADLYKSPLSGLHIEISFGQTLTSEAVAAPLHLNDVADNRTGDFAMRGLSESKPFWYMFPRNKPLEQLTSE